MTKTGRTADALVSLPGTNAILEVSARPFRDQGCEPTTVREAARAAGILPGSLDYRPAAKQDLLLTFMQRANWRVLLGPARLEMVQQRNEHEALREELLADVARAGLLRSAADVRLVRLLAFGVPNSAVASFQPAAGRKPEAIADALFDWVCNGVPATPR